MHPFPVLAIAFLVIYFAERALSNKRSMFYYCYGCPILCMRRSFQVDAPSKDQVESDAHSNLEIVKSEQGLLLFRKGRFRRIGNRLYEFSSARGFISNDKFSGEYRVVCFLNYNVIVLILLLASIVRTMSISVLLWLYLILVVVVASVEIVELRSQLLRLAETRRR